MPNTLAHIGVQTLATRGVLRRAEGTWILLGCVLPDLPWILQRAVRTLAPGVDPYDLRLYAIVQGTLALTLVLCGAVAAVANAPRRVFGILSAGALLHLLLDALQTKLANGVHLFAPFSWELLNLGLFWPESATTLALTALGAAVCVQLWRRRREDAAALCLGSGRAAAAGALLAAYALLPLLLLSGPEAADNHSVRTLRERESRPGRVVEFDREDYARGAGDGDVLVTWADEPLAVEGAHRQTSGTVSARAEFVDAGRIRLLELHDHGHGGWSRDAASYAGLAAVAVYCLVVLWRPGRAALNRLPARAEGSGGGRS